MKKFFLLSLILVSSIISSNGFTQVSQLVIGVDGFTCSLCAKGVEEQFKALDFVKSVKTDLKKTEFTLALRPNPKIEISQIRDAVSDGGFTVRDIKVIAKGSIKGDASIGYTLVTSNAIDIPLKDVKGNFNEGDKVSVKGRVSPEATSIIVTSIKKL